MDLFGKAVSDYFNKTIKIPLYFTYKDISPKRTKKNIKRYFRKYWQLDKLEKKLISMVKGNTLDIGCATGYYIPYMQKRAEVIGVDISDYLIDICHKKGLENCIKQDVFTYEPTLKFDTITLLESNIGLGGSSESLDKLLHKIKDLLNPDGQVLCIQHNYEAEYIDCEITAEYCSERETFTWSYMNLYFLKSQCEDAGFDFDVISHGVNKTYLVRLTLQQHI
ncbi:MAG: class I SAM-dependent methyltransferase [Patescibacteria group bacterium]|jgi:SAM-dependent methyltransferase